MIEDTVEDWSASDARLREIIEKINLSGKSVEEQAQDAFEIIADEYGLPKYPDSFTEEDYKRFDEQNIDTPRSVFEEIAIMRYLEPNEDPRGIILFALHNVKNGIGINIDECAERHFGSKNRIPKEYMIYFLGKGASGELHFLEKDKSWFDMGAKYACKIIKRQSA